MKNILTIIKKELARFFMDIRLVITTLLLPGLMIFGIYSILGEGMSDVIGGDPDYVPIVKTVNMPASIDSLITSNEIELEIEEVMLARIDEIKQEIIDETIDVLMMFETDFDMKVADAIASGAIAPTVDIFYNSTKAESLNAYSLLNGLINAYESSVSNAITLNGDIDGDYDLASEAATMGQILSMVLPFLILSLLFSGCMAVTPESIAGEKERGTIATLLVTPIKRHELAIGKIISLSILASLAAMSSFLGTILSFPKIIGMQGGDASGALSYFHWSDYLGIIFIIVSIVLFFVAFLAILSAYSKSVKEASALAMPFMIVIMLAGVLTMFQTGAESSIIYYLIPIYGPTQALSGIFSFNANWTHILVGGLSSIIYASISGVLLIRMFNSERIMFKR